MSSEWTLTTEQLDAVTTTGCNMLVSAAAGSGKTTVLAERCAHLICDASMEARCDIDKLLVLTFTEAAASEMRSRIVEAIRKRLLKSPQDERLHDQLVLAETAQISTIHGFCLWMIRRWFEEAAVDPMASVLDADEAAILREQVLDELFEQCYAAARSKGASLGEDLLGETNNDKHEFLKLIDIYGLGEDGDIRRFVLKLYEFTTSQPRPEDWLRKAISHLSANSTWALDELARTLHRELRLQIPHAESIASEIESGPSSGHDYGVRARQYVDALAEWTHLLTTAKTIAEGLDQVRERIGVYEFLKVNSARKLSESENQAREHARERLEEAKGLFKARLRERFGYFTSAEWLAGLSKIAPAVRMIVDLVRQFTDHYTARKRRLNVMDFADLERLAYQLVEDANSPVARALRTRFQHVLVDEFQDINPLQQAILEAVSRDRVPDMPGNFFAVGDVKQSIYRFRLAESEIFLARLQSMRGGDARTENQAHGKAHFLQSNFRSRHEILDTVNFVFRNLMTGELGGLAYDSDAELRPGKPKSDTRQLPVELHLLERRVGHEATAGNEEGDAVEVEESRLYDADTHRAPRIGDSPSRWDPIVREAYLIARNIRTLMDAGETWESKPLKYSDIAILLRSTKINADRVAGVLGAMGIPAYAEVGGSLMGALEVREVVAALEVLDNLQQDIPLAGVLRSGIFGDRFNEDELVEIRLLDRQCPFHEVVRSYAERGPDQALRARLHALLGRIRRYRTDVTRRPLSHTVWNLLERQGYMACAAGLPCGSQRKANLLKLYELSRRFSLHRRQGLHRFLQLLHSLADEDQAIAVAPTGGAGDNVVRIMSIHRAKGMEFPVVFLAGLGTKFNLGDRNGRMIFERKAKIGLRAIDSEKMIEYPTAVHQLVSIEVENSTRDEELRILYVGMTRAQQRLILVGSVDEVRRCDDLRNRRITSLRIATARTPLDWLLPVVGTMEPGQGPDIRVMLHDADEISTWSMERSSDMEQQKLLETIGAFAELPPDEPVAAPKAEVDETLRRINSIYPYLAASSIPATLAASEIGRLLVTGEKPKREVVEQRVSARIESPGIADEFDAAERGTIFHRVLQHLDFDKARDASGVAKEMERIAAEGLLDAAEMLVVAQDDLVWLAGTPVAEMIRRAGPLYHRELRFITTEPLSALDANAHTIAEDRVLVRGMIDGIVESQDECEIIDFKTDAITATEALARCEMYRPQMETYARSVERLWRRPVRRCRLVFLKARRIVDLERKTTSA